MYGSKRITMLFPKCSTCIYLFFISPIYSYCASHSIQLSSFNKKQTTIVSTSPSSGVDNLRNFTEELQEIMHEKLLSENNEERARWKYLLQTMEKSRVAFNACQQLRNSLENCTALKDQVVSLLLFFSFLFPTHLFGAESKL